MSFMLREFLAAPESLRAVINKNNKVIDLIAKEFKERGILNITTVARGTSDNAATYFKYLAEVVGGIMVSKFSPSITTVYKSEVNLKNNMVLAISQSGQSIDTLTVVESAKKTGALTVAVTNDKNSPLAKACHYHIDSLADEELSVAASKTFIAQMGVLYMLANKLSPISAKMNILHIPPLMEKFIGQSNTLIKELAGMTKNFNNFVILSRGLLQSVTAELSLKLMQSCHKLSRPFSTAEFLHGPVSWVEEGSIVYLLAPDSEFRDEYISMATRLSLLGATVVAFTDIKEVEAMAHYSLPMPSLRGMETPFIYTIAIELLVTHTAEALQINPDLPRYMKKVTITV